MSMKQQTYDQKVQQLCYQAVKYLHQQKHHRAIGCYLLALEIAEERGSSGMVASLLHCVGATYQRIEKYTQAKQYYHRVLDLLPETDEQLRPLTLRQMGEVMQQHEEKRRLFPFIFNQWMGGGAELMPVC